METLSRSYLEAPVEKLVPSLAPSPYPALSQETSTYAVPPATITASPKQCPSPLPSPTGSCNPTAIGSAPCGDFWGRASSLGGGLGVVGVESNLFHRKSQHFCKKHSKRRCWRVKSAAIRLRCKRNAFLGTRFAPSCCFYLRCLSFRRPSGSRSTWWKHTGVRHMVWRACRP